jgi:hypothetical protein
MTQKFANAARAYLVSTVSDSATTVTIDGGGSLFPAISSPEFSRAVLQDADGIEVVLITAHTAGSNSFTVTRGQEGTTARSFAAGSVFGIRLTAADADAFASTTIANKVLQAYSEKVTTVGVVSTSTYNINMSLSNIFDITLGNNVTFTFTNPPPAGTLASVTVILRQDGSGNRTATFTGALYTDGNLPELSTGANNVDMLTYFTVDGGSTYFGTFAMANVS